MRKTRARLAELIKERGSLEFLHGPMMSAHAAHPPHRFVDTFVPDLVAAMFVEAITSGGLSRGNRTHPKNWQRKRPCWLQQCFGKSALGHNCWFASTPDQGSLFIDPLSRSTREAKECILIVFLPSKEPSISFQWAIR